MPNLYVTVQGARVEREYNRLVVSKGREVLAEVPAIQVSEVVLVGRVGVTTPALQMLLERGIGLVLLNQQLSPFRRDWDQTLASLADDARQVVSKLLAVINTLLSGILATDKEDGALLSARKQMVASELSGLSGGRIANQCYARSMPATGTSSADLTG